MGRGKANGISARTIEVFNLIRQVIITTNYPPTYEEIGNALGLSRSDAFYHVGILKEFGLLNSKYYGPRSLELKD